VRLLIASATNVNVGAGAMLTIGNPTTVSAGKSLNTSGNVVFQAPLIIGASGAMAVAEGRPTLSGPPSLAAHAVLDVRNNSLLIDYGDQPTPAADVKEQLAH